MQTQPLRRFQGGCGCACPGIRTVFPHEYGLLSRRLSYRAQPLRHSITRFSRLPHEMRHLRRALYCFRLQGETGKGHHPQPRSGRNVLAFLSESEIRCPLSWVRSSLSFICDGHDKMRGLLFIFPALCQPSSRSSLNTKILFQARQRSRFQPAATCVIRGFKTRPQQRTWAQRHFQDWF